MSSIELKRFPIAGAFAAMAFALTACENTLIYAERTGFNLAIYANENPATPLEVNGGLKRSVVGLVPPTKVKKENETSSGESRAEGEAVSMFSGFRLTYDEGEGPFAGDLSIRTQFASGVAAITIANGQEPAEAVKKIVNVKSANFGNLPSIQRVRAWLAANPDNLNLLKQWAAQNASDISVPALRFGEENEVERLAAIDDLQIP